MQLVVISFVFWAIWGFCLQDVWSSPQMESALQEPLASPACHALISGTNPCANCFKFLCRDGAEDGVQWALSAKMVRLFLATLTRVCLVSKPRQLAMLLRPPPFSRMTETKVSLSGDDGQFSSFSAESLSYRSTEPSGTSVHKDFLLGMKMAACHAGFFLCLRCLSPEW